MAKIKNPITLSSYYKIDKSKLDSLNIFDPTLAFDTKLAIDPLLLSKCSHPEISKEAVQQYKKHFELIIKFLINSNNIDDIAWRTARKLLEFHEIRGTCLGYGDGSIGGSGFGPSLTDRVLRLAKEIVDLGVLDPDLFPAMALFEEDIGPDRISDMTTNVIIKSLIKLNERVLKKFKLAGERFEINGTTGYLLKNPFQIKRTPIILVPKDTLSELPIAGDWESISYVASQNQALRNRVNEHIGHIWAVKAKRDKLELKKQVLYSKEAFDTLLDTIHKTPPNSYNVTSDKKGLVRWAHIAPKIANRYTLNLQEFKHPNKPADVYQLVLKIVEQFKHIIENHGLNKELYKENGDPRPEPTAQRLFFAISYCYCKANNVDVNPEIDTGTGKIDFKFSKGFNSRVLVELKLSTNTRLMHGYETQLETYKESEETTKAIFVVIDVGKMGKKDENLIKLRNQKSSEGLLLSDLIFVDGLIKPTASKR